MYGLAINRTLGPQPSFLPIPNDLGSFLNAQYLR